MRLGGHVHDEQRVGIAILPLNGAIRGSSGAGDELGTGARILENHRVVVGVNILLH